MNFRKHSDLEGKHAFLSASKYHWLNYDMDKLVNSYLSFLSVQRGTDLHDLAKRCIELQVKMPKNKMTFNQYVNDAIGFQMTPEQPLYFSENCFGTADAISFNDQKLRIHDLKTGVSPASIHQLEIYAALFCLEYHVNPSDIFIELRLYQSNEVIVQTPPAEVISAIMDKIVLFDKEIEKIKSEG